MIYNIRNYDYKTHPPGAKLYLKIFSLQKRRKVRLMVFPFCSHQHHHHHQHQHHHDQPPLPLLLLQDRVVTPLLLTERGDRTAPLRGAVHYTEVH